MASVAETILEQLGGGRFVVMTGARNMVAYPNALKLRLPSLPHYTKDGINCVHIQLELDDTYTVAFHKIGRAPGFKVELKEELTGVYAESLREVFTSTTGLAVSL